MKNKELERVLKALANRRRLAILLNLKRHKRASVGDTAAEINLSFNATSKHLGILYGAGILDREQHGLTMFYSVAPDVPAAARYVISIL